jgi:hypothetical protein
VASNSRTAPLRRAGLAAALLLTTTAAMAPASAQAQLPTTLNDLADLGAGQGQVIVAAPQQLYKPAPKLTQNDAKCPAGSHTEPGVDGQVPSGSADKGGLYCHASLVAHQGSSGGFKTIRYVDQNGHVCAIYDTALLFPTNALNFNASSAGVAVLDMSDPAHPVQTAQLTDPSMLSPHESLLVNQKRGLIAAVSGNPDTYPGWVAFYDASKDCRHPVLQFSGLLARLGHESGFSQDGKTFYATSVNNDDVTAIDVTDPKNPFDVWLGQLSSHGMSLSDDGNRGYVADTTGQLIIVDTSQIQARKPDPQVKEISRLTWTSVSIPQNALPFTENGHPYLLEFDEYTAGTTGSGDKNAVGAGRIIDIGDERHPTVVANLRLQVNQPAEHAAAANDPGASSPVQGYAAHYCNIPTRVDPKIVACSFIASGLRVFDISDLTHPKEIAYYVAPTQPTVENGYMASDFAMSQPTFDVARRDVWFTDGASGFYNVHIDDWPTAAAPTTAHGRCASRRRFTVTVRAPRGTRIVSQSATLAGKRIATRRHGRVVTTVARLIGLPRDVVHLVVRVKLSNGRTITSRRTYHPCQHRA